MELKSAMKTFFPFKIVCNDRGKPCSSDWKSWSFQMKKNIVVKYKIKSKKLYCRLLSAMTKKINQ